MRILKRGGLVLYPLRNKGNNTYISQENFEKCYNFSKTMIEKGYVHSFRKGGSQQRNKLDKMGDIFQGKIAEYAFFNIAYDNGVLLDEPDFSVGGEGYFDNGDFIYNSYHLSIKSCRFNARLLMLEKESYNSEGIEFAEIKPIKNDFICLIKVYFVYNNENYHLKDFFAYYEKGLVTYENIRIEFPGYVTFSDLKKKIDAKDFQKKGSSIGFSKVTLDADNYIWNIKSLRKINTLWELLKKEIV